MSSFGPESITFFTQASPNGHSIAVALEELGLKYNVKPLDFSKKEQKEVRLLFRCQARTGATL